MENQKVYIPVFGYEDSYKIYRENEQFHIYSIKGDKELTITYRKSRVIHGVQTLKGYVNLVTNGKRKDLSVEALWELSVLKEREKTPSKTFQRLRKKPLLIEDCFLVEKSKLPTIKLKVIKKG